MPWLSTLAQGRREMDRVRIGKPRTDVPVFGQGQWLKGVETQWAARAAGRCQLDLDRTAQHEIESPVDDPKGGTAGNHPATKFHSCVRGSEPAVHRMPGAIPAGVVEIVGASSTTRGTQAYLPVLGTIDIEARCPSGLPVDRNIP